MDPAGHQLLMATRAVRELYIVAAFSATAAYMRWGSVVHLQRRMNDEIAMAASFQ